MRLTGAAFNFTHHINELSFGPYYPSLVNPLDYTVAETDLNFYKFQYYCSIVPTIYTTDVHHLKLSPNADKKSAEPLTNLDPGAAGSWGSTIWTNQYAVTSQSHNVPENKVPGIFFKYDIEPILLVVNEERGGFLALVVRLVNVISGILVAGAWFLRLSDVLMEGYSKSGGRERVGFLGTRDEKFV
jgi:endoplasmic reticulum-Golgi intermediate compartment protein 2